MAIQKEMVHLGLTISEAYHKITEIRVDCTMLEDPKKYKVHMQLQSFTNDTKDYIFDSVTYSFLANEEEITLSKCYEYLKQQEVFLNSLDV